jgi:aspartate racemase
MKTIGVLGGLGPQATMDFEARVHKVSQALIPQSWNTGYPPMVVYFHRYPPFVVDEYGIPAPPIRPDPHLMQGVGKLGEMVDFIVIPSNAPHTFKRLIEEATGHKVLSMIDATTDEVRRLGWRRVGLVGLGEPRIYQEPLDGMGIAHETLSGEDGGLRTRLDRKIIAFMEGQAGPEGCALAAEAIEALRARGVDGIILGCTEIPLLLGEATQAPDLINPAQLLAEAAVRFAME